MPSSLMDSYCKQTDEIFHFSMLADPPNEEVNDVQPLSAATRPESFIEPYFHPVTMATTIIVLLHSRP